MLVDSTGDVHGVSLNTVSGNATIRLDEGLPANYAIRSVSGRVQVDGVVRSGQGGITTNYTGSVGELSGTLRRRPRQLGLGRRHRAPPHGDRGIPTPRRHRRRPRHRDADSRQRGVVMAPVFSHGDLRLYLLNLLDEGPRHGYDIMQALSDRTGGTYTPSAGTIYPRLAKLEEEGLVTKTVDGRKTIYQITEAGHAEVQARAGDLEGIEAGLADSVRLIADEVRGSVREAMKSLRADLAAAHAGRARRPDEDGCPVARRRRAHRRAASSCTAPRPLVGEFRARVRSDLRTHVARGGALGRTVVDDLESALDAALARSRAHCGAEVAPFALAGGGEPTRGGRDAASRPPLVRLPPLTRRSRNLGLPDLLVVRHRLSERHDQHRPVLAVREAHRHRAREELADRLADPVLARADDDEPRVELVGEVLDRDRGVADELADRPRDLAALESRGRLGLDVVSSPRRRRCSCRSARSARSRRDPRT